jgi:general secretion pathway protein L
VGIDTIFKRWIDLLAGLLVGMQESWRARRSLVIVQEHDGFIVRQGKAQNKADGPSSVARPTAGVPLSAELVRAARKQFVTLELPSAEVVLQRINVPAQAREFVAGIVSNQIERLSPWPGDQVTYGFAVETNRDDVTILDVRIVMVAREFVDAARDKLTATGLSIDRIVACTQSDPTAAPITLRSQLDGASERNLRRARRLIAASMTALFIVSIGLSAWALVSAAAIQTESDDASARVAALQRQEQGSRTSPASASHDPAKRAWSLKETSPAAVIILETLSQALPDTAYITDLSLNKTTIRIAGICSDAPSLVAPLENSGLLADVHFFAPTTRSPDGAGVLYHIEARIEPRLDRKEN